jgi:hypothetical protein
MSYPDTHETILYWESLATPGTVIVKVDPTPPCGDSRHWEYGYPCPCTGGKR